MSFLSYRTRIPRHFDSHANVRSTTHRRGLWPCDRSQPFFSSPIRRMCGKGCGRRPFPRWVVVRLIQGHVLRLILCRFGPLDHDTLDRRCQEPPFQHVRPGDHHPQRSTVAIGHQALFGALFSSVGGILARLFPPQAGLAQHRVGRLPLPLHPAEFVTLGDQDRPDSLEDPCCSPAPEPVVDSALGLYRSAMVRLAAAAQPDMIAFSIFRQLATFRPVGFLGQNSKRIGSIRRHNSSEISQIVPSGLRRGLRRTMAQSPVVMPGSGHCLLQAPSCKRCSAGAYWPLEPVSRIWIRRAATSASSSLRTK